MQDTINRVLDRIVSVASPLRIILFGSAARGDMEPSSDLDLLVVIAPGRHRRKTAQMIYRNLVDIGFAVDLVVVTSQDVTQYRDHPGMVIGTDLAEGRELYAA